MPGNSNNGNNSNISKPTPSRPTPTGRVVIRDGSGNKDNSRLDDLLRRR